ncbi:MAG: outer membrane lipoprotein carrier protein LolA [Candidatus Hatepunaea meridiana]|nr:outer membrane lipoprotein carrier protein LolA [Candidatus Hatepunaea meridiana]
MNVRLITYLLLAIYFVSTGSVEAMSPNSALKKLRKRYKKVNSLSADFREVFEWEMTGETIIRKGSITIIGGFRFRIDTPEQLLVADGKNIFRYNRIKKQIIIEPINSTDDQLLPRKLMLDFADGFSASNITSLTVNSKEGFRLDLLPDNPDEILVSSATLWATTENLVVHRMKLLDLNSNSTTYYLSNIQINQPVDVSQTTFTPPEGVEIFDLR